MKKIKIAIQVLLFIILLLICSKVSAASMSLTPSKSTLTVGEEFTISMRLSGASLASLNVKITVDTSKVEYVSSNAPSNTNFNNGKILYTWTDTSGGSNPKGEGTIATFTLKAKSTGTANFNVSGNFYDVDENSVNMSLSGTSVTIINNPQVVTPPEEQPSENTIPGEVVTPEEPTPEEPNPPTEENPDEPPETNPEQPSEEIYPITPPEENDNENASSNTYLKSLQVNVEGISPRFNKYTTKYYLIVDNTVDAVTINATPEDESSRVDVTGNQDLQIGENIATIIVTSQSGDTRNYTIQITKTDDPNNANTNLENLAIENATLSPEFSKDILEYSTKVTKDIEKLNVLAVPEIEGASVKITGGDTLSFGNNIITVTVTAKNGTSVKIYTVNVYKMTEAEEIEENNRILEETNINSNIITDQNIVENNKTNLKNENKGNIGLWAIFIVLLIAIIGIVVYLIRKRKN